MTEVVPFITTPPRPVPGWVRSLMVSGTLPSGSLSFCSRLRVIGMPTLVLPISAWASGGWLAASTGALPTTTTGSTSLPPRADLTVMVAGGCGTSLTVRLCSVPALDRRP
ncbi:hypothetical protein D3C75_882330 [compost metagenome]